MTIVAGIKYTLVGNEYAVGTNTNNLYDNKNAVIDENLKFVNLPEKIENKVVSRVGTASFRNSDITTAFIPATITSIGVDSFGYCHKLRKVTFAEGSKLTYIDQGAFYDCPLLKTMHLPPTVSTIIKWAFGKQYLDSFYYCGLTDFSSNQYVFSSTSAEQFFPKTTYVRELYEGTSFSENTHIIKSKGCWFRPCIASVSCNKRPDIISKGALIFMLIS